MGASLPEQAVEARTTDVCGVDMSPVNLYRWTPAFAAGVQLPGCASLSAGYLAHLFGSTCGPAWRWVCFAIETALQAITPLMV